MCARWSPLKKEKKKKKKKGVGGDCIVTLRPKTFASVENATFTYIQSRRGSWLVQTDYESRPRDQKQNFHCVQRVLLALYKKTNRLYFHRSFRSGRAVFISDTTEYHREKQRTSQHREANRLNSVLSAAKNEVFVCYFSNSVYLSGLQCSAKLRHLCKRAHAFGKTFFLAYFLFSYFFVEKVSWINFALPWLLTNF